MLKIIFAFAACLLLANTTYANESEYDQALVNTALHRSGVATQPLAVIQGSTVRMTTFTTYSKYKTTDKKAGADIWVTVEPELKKLCTQFVKQHQNKFTHEQLTLWLAQLLGLPSQNVGNRQFVVIEVPVIQAYYGDSYSTTGIFRPCTDPQIGVAACAAQMRTDDTKIASEFKTWFINYSMSTYQDKGMPWTEYGYTYNWNPQTENKVGVSEFVITKDTPISVVPNPEDSSSPYISPEQYCS